MVIVFTDMFQKLSAAENQRLWVTESGAHRVSDMKCDVSVIVCIPLELMFEFNCTPKLCFSHFCLCLERTIFHKCEATMSGV